VFGKAPLIGPIGVFFVEMSRVAQKDFTQVMGGMGTMDLSLETLFAQPGQVAGVVNVSVGEENPIYLSRGN
jgi:hypothetical protein